MTSSNSTDRNLPAGWTLSSLEDVADILDGKRVPINAKERETRTGRVPYYGATGQVRWIDGHLFDDELVLLGEDGAPFLDTSKPKAYVIRGKSWVNNHAHVLRAKDGTPNAYLKYFLDRFDDHGFVTGTTRLKLTQAAMRQIPVRLAPPEDRKRIVAEIEEQFSCLDEAVASLKRTKANLKRYKAAVLKAAVEGKIGSTGTEKWIRTNLGAVLTAIEAGKSFKCEERTPSHQETGVVKVSAVTWGTYNEEESKTCLDSGRVAPRYFVRPGDFLFSRANTIELVGACVIAQTVTRNVMLSDKILRFRFSDDVLPQWVLYWLRSDIGRKEIQRLSTGNQESMRNIGQDRIRQVVFALPSLGDQHQIVAEVERRLSVIDELEATVEANLTRADRLRQLILSHAFAGKLVGGESRTRSPLMHDLPIAAESSPPCGAAS